MVIQPLVSPLYFSLLSFCLLFGIGIFLRKEVGVLSVFRKVSVVFLFALIVICVRLSFVDWEIQNKNFTRISHANFFLGEIVSEPKFGNQINSYQFKITAIKNKNDNATTTLIHPITVELRPSLGREYIYGDVLFVSGSCVLPKVAPDFHEATSHFDYQKVLWQKGMACQISFPKVTYISHVAHLISYLFTLKKAFAYGIEQLIPEPQSSLLLGVLLGEQLPLGGNEVILRTLGLSHIIVLSGYNISLVLTFVLLITVFLPRMVALPLSAGIAFLFVLMTGAGISGFRALMMSSLSLVAILFGRKYHGGVALSVAVIFVLLFDPLILYSISFLLTFLASFAIIFIAPIFEKKFTFITEKFSLREIVSATIATELTVLPVIVLISHQFSLLSIVANILILPIVPLIMVFGFLVGFLYCLVPFIALPFAWISYVLLSYVFMVSNFLIQIPFSIIHW